MDGKEAMKNVILQLEKSFSRKNYEATNISKWKIIKNLTVISSSFLFLFAAYGGLSMLQSTLNQEQGIGVASQAIIYAAFCISALLLPKYTIKKYGCKKTLLISVVAYIPYIAANFWFNWISMVPSAILLGLAASPLWSSQCTYFNESASNYAKLCVNNKTTNKQLKTSSSVTDTHYIYESKSNLESLDCAKLHENYKKNELNDSNDVKNTEINSLKNYLSNMNLYSNDPKELKSNNLEIYSSVGQLLSQETSTSIEDEEYSKLVPSVTACFFGMFGLMYRVADVCSNLMSYYVLNNDVVLDNITEYGNCSCGSSFCNVNSECFEHNLAEPNQEMRNILTAVSVVLAVLATIIILLFLDELGSDKEPTEFSLDLALSTLKFAKRKEALLLLPLSSYIGMQQGFYIGDFTKAYVACAWGVHHVGLVTLAYAVGAGLSAPLAGFLVKYVGRVAVIAFGAIINVAVCIFLLIWIPMPSQGELFFLAAALVGSSTGIIWSQVRAYYGVLFKEDEEAAFAGFYFFDAIGYCAAFSCSNYLCTYVKLYILLAVSTIGMTGYLKTEYLNFQKKNSSRQ